eukprot:gene5248-10501_t
MNSDNNICVGIICCGYTVGIPIPSIWHYWFTTDQSQPFSLIERQKKNPFRDNTCLIAFVCLLNVFLTPIFKSYFVYSDTEFPPNSFSLGFTGSDTRNKLEWIRLQDLDIPNQPGVKVNCIFDKTIAPSDICQGGLGDCWLLAGFATLSEKPALIQKCFVTSIFNPMGRYTIKLFDHRKNQFVNITIDDFIPCQNGVPYFTKLTCNEVWPILLEKAVAKLRGSYRAIEGGLPLDAMRIVTGYEGERFTNMQDNALFQKIQHLVYNGSLLAAGTSGVDRSRTFGRDSVEGSIVPGHAYSILDVKTPRLTTHTVRLLKLRNPWGEMEWKGDWSDSSPLWQTHPGVALEIGRPDISNDGIFYMSFDDFIKYFDMIDVLYCGVSMDTLHLRVQEHVRCCGTPIGCVCGCLNFWCCCNGCYTLWFHRTSNVIKDESREFGMI